MPSNAFLAYNIINQLGDLWSERIPSEQWVPVRQATNDIADEFVTRLLNERAAAVWDECLAAIDANEINTEQAREGNPYRSAHA